MTIEDKLSFDCETTLKNKLIVIDIETTGFNHKLDSIIEIGIVELDINTGKIKILFKETFNK